MQVKVDLDKILSKIGDAELDTCQEAVDFIKNLDMNLYSPAEIKIISEKLGDRINTLLQMEMKEKVS